MKADTLSGDGCELKTLDSLEEQLLESRHVADGNTGGAGEPAQQPPPSPGSGQHEGHQEQQHSWDPGTANPAHGPQQRTQQLLAVDDTDEANVQQRTLPAPAAHTGLKRSSAEMTHEAEVPAGELVHDTAVHDGGSGGSNAGGVSAAPVSAADPALHTRAPVTVEEVATAAEAAEAAAATPRSKRQRVPVSTWPTAALPINTLHQQQQQQHPLGISHPGAASGAAANTVLLPACFPLLSTAAAGHHQASIPMVGLNGAAATMPQVPPAAATTAVLSHHLSGISVPWSAAQPVMSLPGGTIQAAAAAAAAAAATATRAAMGQDPSLGWTPAMAAAAMVAAAGAHEGAAVTAAAAAPRHHRHAAGRRRRAAAKDEDISSRQGSLRVFDSVSAGGVTKGVSAEVSDAAQPAPTAGKSPAAAAAVRLPLSCLGPSAAGAAPEQPFHVLGRQPGMRAAGISSGPAAAEVQGLAGDDPNQAELSGLITASPHTADTQAMAAAAEAVGSPLKTGKDTAAGVTSADASLDGVQGDTEMPDDSSNPEATAAAAAAGLTVGELSRRFQEQQMRQQQLCLASIHSGAVTSAAAGRVDSLSPPAAGCVDGGLVREAMVQRSGSSEQQQQQQQQQPSCYPHVCGGITSAPLLPHWAPLGYHHHHPVMGPTATAPGLTAPGLVITLPSATAAGQRSGSDPLSSALCHQGPQSGHNSAMLAAAAAAAAAGLPPVSTQAVLPGLTAAGVAHPQPPAPPPATAATVLGRLTPPQQSGLPLHHQVTHGPSNPAAAAAVGGWLPPGPSWHSPWPAAGSGTGPPPHHLALSPSGAAAAAAGIRGLPLTPTAAAGAAHLPALLPVAPLQHPHHQVPAVGPGPLLPVAPVLGHNAGPPRAPEPVTPAEASMTSAAARLQQLQQQEAATLTPSAGTTMDVAPAPAGGEATTADTTEHILKEVSRQLQQHAVQQQQQQMAQAVAAAAAAAAMTDADVVMQNTIQAAAAKGLADAGAAPASLAAVGGYLGGSSFSKSSVDLVQPVAAAWVGAQQQQDAASFVLHHQQQCLVDALDLGDNQQKNKPDKGLAALMQQQDVPAVVSSCPQQQLLNSGRSTSTGQPSSGGANQASQPQQQQQQGSGSNGNGSGSGQTAADVAAVVDNHHPQRPTALPPPPPKQPGGAAAAAVTCNPTHRSDNQQAAAAAVADAKNAAVAIAAAAVAAAANVAAHAAVTTGASGTGHSAGTHMLGFVTGSSGLGSGGGSGGNGSGGTGGSGSNAPLGSNHNMVASNALTGSNGNGNGSGADGSGSGGMGSGTAAAGGGGGSGGTGSGPDDTPSEPCQQLPASAAVIATAQQQLLHAMFPAVVPGHGAGATPVVSPAKGVMHCDAQNKVQDAAAAAAAVMLNGGGVAGMQSCTRQVDHEPPPPAAAPAQGVETALLRPVQQQLYNSHRDKGAALQLQQQQLEQYAAATLQGHAGLVTDTMQQQHQIQSNAHCPIAGPCLAAAAMVGPNHPTSPGVAHHLVYQQQQQQQQQQQAVWWQQQQLLLAQQACQWHSGLSQQAALLQHLPAAVAVMGLHGLNQWPLTSIVGPQWSQQQQIQQQQLQQQAVAAAAAGGIAAATQHHLAQLQQAAAHLPDQVAAAAAAGVPVMDSGGVQGENVVLTGLGGGVLTGSGNNAAAATDAAGGAADGSAGGATAGNGSGGTGDATAGGSGNGSGGTAGGTGHGSGGTHGTTGTAGINGSGASWGVKGSNTVGGLGLINGGHVAAGSSWAAAQYSGAALPGILPGGLHHHAAAGNQFVGGMCSGVCPQQQAYTSQCAENTQAGTAGRPAAAAQQQHVHSQHQHMVPPPAGDAHQQEQQQQQFLQQCQSLMQQQLQRMQQPATAAAAVPGHVVDLMPGQADVQQQQQQRPPVSASPYPCATSQPLSMQEVLWLQQNAASAVQHSQLLQQQQRATGVQADNIAALNSWVPSALPGQGAATAMQTGALAAAAAAVMGGSSAAAGAGGSAGAHGSGGGTGGGTGNGSNDPEGTAAAAALGTANNAAGNLNSIVASSSWMPSNMQRQQHHVQELQQPAVSAAMLPHLNSSFIQQPQPQPSLPSGLLPSIAAAAAGLGFTANAAALGVAAGGSSGNASLMGLGNLLPPISSGLAAAAVAAATAVPSLLPQVFAAAGSCGGLGGPSNAAATLPAQFPTSSAPSLWPSNFTNAAALGVTPQDLLPAAALLQQIIPNAGWAELGAQTAACFQAGLSPNLYWQYLTAAALLAQPPSSAAMVNAARAYHYFQQYLHPHLLSDWLDERTHSLASSAASEESAKDRPNVDRREQQQQQHQAAGVTDSMEEEEDMAAAAAEEEGAGLDKQAATVGVADADKAAAVAVVAPACVAVRAGRKRRVADTDSEQDEASSRRKYK